MLTGTISDFFLPAAEALIFYYGYPWVKARFKLYTKAKQTKTEWSDIQQDYLLLVPFRNEETRIGPLLKSLEKTQFPGKLEIVFINDHSSDFSVNVIESALPTVPYKTHILHCPEDVQGKKNALNFAINQYSAHGIFTIDADCSFSENMLALQAQKFEQENLNLLVSPVMFLANNSPLQQYQRLENMCLVSLGLGHLIQGSPTMANGANLLFRRDIFLAVNPYQNNQQVVGGDDIFLLESIFSHDAEKVGYSLTSEFAVNTPVLSTWRELWQQRVRWVRKTKHQNTKFTRNSQIHLAIFYVLFWGIIAGSMWYGHDDFSFALFYLKTAMDCIIIYNFTTFWKIPTNLYQLLAASILQSFFIPLLGIGQLFGKTHWKGRDFSLS